MDIFRQSARALEKRAAEPVVGRYEDAPGAYSLEITLPVYGSIPLMQAINTGAPNTALPVKDFIAKSEHSFPPNSLGSATKKIFLICFGRYLIERRVEKMCTSIKERYGMQDVDLRTLLAVTQNYNTLCRGIGVPSMRLVCKVQRVAYRGETHVCVHHQHDDHVTVQNALRLEPYKYGWSAEHVFLFEKILR